MMTVDVILSVTNFTVDVTAPAPSNTIEVFTLIGENKWGGIYGNINDQTDLITLINSIGAPSWSDIFNTIDSEAELITLISNATTTWGDLFTTITDEADLLYRIANASPNLGANLIGFGDPSTGNITSYSGFKFSTSAGFYVQPSAVAIDYALKVDKYGVKIGKSTDLVGANTYPFEVPGLFFLPNGILYSAPNQQAYLQLNDIIAQIGFSETRVVYNYTNILYYINGASRQFKMEAGSLLRGDTDAPFLHLSTANGTEFGYDTQYINVGGGGISFITQGITRSSIDPTNGMQLNLPLSINVTAGDYGLVYNKAGGYTWKWNVDGSNYLRMGAVSSGNFYIEGDFYFTMPSAGDMRLGIGRTPLDYQLEVKGKGLFKATGGNSAELFLFSDPTSYSIESITFKEDNSNGYTQIVRFNSTYGSTYGGTSIATQNSFAIDNSASNNAIVLRGGPVYQLTGTSALNYAVKLDPNGFRIATAANIASANTYAFEVTSGVSVFGGQVKILDNTFFGGLGSPTAWIDIAGGTVSQAQLRFRPGAIVSAPNDGDVWYNGTDLFFRNGLVTKTFNFGGGGTPGGSTLQVQYNNAGAFAGSSKFITNGVNYYFGGTGLAVDAGYRVRVDSETNGVKALGGLSYGYGAAANYGLYFLSIASTTLNIGLYAEANGVIDENPNSLISIGGWFKAGDGSTANYALKLQDGTEGVGKTLVSTLSTGEANWSSHTQNAMVSTGDITVQANNCVVVSRRYVISPGHTVTLLDNAILQII
jgi:hypothetical protein